ncbi:unnamed protein product [Medioppia subpectinata]|uniref:Protein transport protein Sec61 subunit gamma n=1 Tax=Medioppia subpectinata TaxID=1979941 RepID=A0A7R9Q3Y5_9ACAR|nr:unnamed protein product [Medioppia subpectinata]CAG2111995.1 unnamed protein product [Medioppia subpectinata]
MDQVMSFVEPGRQFAKDSIRLVKRCTKPDRKEFQKIAMATAIGFAIMGFIGFFVKLIHIPINNIIVTCIPESTKPFTRTRRRKEYNRTNRSHPPTVASILKQAADNEKKQKAIELNERQRSEHKDQESQTICDTNDTNCETNQTTDITELSSE